MSQQKQRQRGRPNGRLTRGFSTLPAEESGESSSSSSELVEEQKSEVNTKTKKIHHMTIKAMERRQKKAEEREKEGQKPEQEEEEKQVLKPPARKRGRPRGSRRVIADKEQYEANINSESISEERKEESQKQKKAITLRKRSAHKKMIDGDSNEEIVEKPQKSEEKEPKHKVVKLEIQIGPISSIQVQQPVQTGPKKRGRKKKIQPIPEPVRMVEEADIIAPRLKVYTKPKTHTYDNYHKYYQTIIEQTRQNEKPETPLIFDRFTDPKAYKSLIRSLSPQK